MSLCVYASSDMVVLGGTLEETSGLGLGCMCVSGQYTNGVPLSEEASFALFKGVYDAGCRHFDTAEVYKSGAFNAPPTKDTVFNESQLGKFFAAVPRSSFTVATKYMPYIHALKADYETVRAALLVSLGKLGLEYIDLYYTHRVVSLEYAIEFVRSCKRLKEEGLIKNIGLSEISAPWLREAHKVHPICCIQQEWSLLTRDMEEDLVPTCAELGIGIVAYSPLARNILTVPKERPQDQRRAGIPRYSEDNWEKNKAMLQKLEDLATKKGVSPAQLSLAWLIQKAVQLNATCMPIPGSANLHHCLENVAAAKVKLSLEDMKLLEEIAKESVGARESDAYMAGAVEGQKLRTSNL